MPFTRPLNIAPFLHDNLPPTWSRYAADARRDGDDVGLAPPP